MDLSADLSHLDKKYFINPHVYNCPFCKRNNVAYTILLAVRMDWSNDKSCFVYFVQCNSYRCGKISLHFSHAALSHKMKPRPRPPFDPGSRPALPHKDEDTLPHFEFEFEDNFEDDLDIDSKLFFSHPSSFFLLDSRIPMVIRALIDEAGKARQANLLVGASACLRKAIYVLLDYEKSIVLNPTTGRADYQKSVKRLQEKEKFSSVSKEYFEALGKIQGLTSDIVHEGSWESCISPIVKKLIDFLKGILNEMYIIPDEKKKGLSMLDQLKQTITANKETKVNESDATP